MAVTLPKSLSTLYERVERAFRVVLQEQREELLALPDVSDIIASLSDEIGQAIDEYLPEDTFPDAVLENTRMMISYCLENMALFTDEPEGGLSCILDKHEEGKKKSVTAQHTVYHNLYNSLHDYLECVVEEWYYEQPPQKKEESDIVCYCCGREAPRVDATLVGNNGVEDLWWCGCKQQEEEEEQ